MTIELVFFDAGETLVRPHPSFPELFARVCTEAGRPIEPSEVLAVQRRLAPYLVDLAHDTGVDNPSLSAENSRRFWTHLYERFLAELGMTDAALAAKLYATFSSSAAYALFDDVVPTLEALKSAGYRLGLISNFERWLEEILAEHGVDHYFDPTVISAEAGVEKPDVRIYEIALERARVDPGRTLHVGDSPHLDAVPATAAGMNVLLIDRAGHLDETPVPKIRSLQEIPDFLANL